MASVLDHLPKREQKEAEGLHLLDVPATVRFLSCEPLLVGSSATPVPADSTG